MDMDIDAVMDAWFSLFHLNRRLLPTKTGTEFQVVSFAPSLHIFCRYTGTYNDWAFAFNLDGFEAEVHSPKELTNLQNYLIVNGYEEVTIEEFAKKRGVTLA